MLPAGLVFGCVGLVDLRRWWYAIVGAVTTVVASSAFFAFALPATVVGPLAGYVGAAVLLGLARLRSALRLVNWAPSKCQ